VSKTLLVALIMIPLTMSGVEQTVGQEVPASLWKRVALLEAVAMVSDSGEITKENFNIACGFLVMTMKTAATPEEFKRYFSSEKKIRATWQRVAAELFDLLDKQGCLLPESSSGRIKPLKPDPGS